MFDPCKVLIHSSMEIDHEIFSMSILFDHEIFSMGILSLLLIQEGQFPVSGERMCTSTD